MNLIDLEEKISYKLNENINIENCFVKYTEEFFNKLKYNISVLNKTEEIKFIKSISDLIILLNKKQNNINICFEELFPNKIISLKKEKKYKSCEDNKDIVLSFVLEMNHFYNISKKVKCFLDNEKELVNKFGYFKDGFVFFNLQGIEGFSDLVKRHAEDFKIKFEIKNIDNKEYFVFPLERFMLLNYSNDDISILIHLIISAYKYLYTIENCGKDFVKRIELKAELDKWKKVALDEVNKILKKRS